MGGGGKGGGKGGTPNVNVQPSPYEQAMANIANEYYKMSGPTRQYFLEDWARFLRPPGETGYFSGGREGPPLTNATRPVAGGTPAPAAGGTPSYPWITQSPGWNLSLTGGASQQGPPQSSINYSQLTPMTFQNPGGSLSYLYPLPSGINPAAVPEQLLSQLPGYQSGQGFYSVNLLGGQPVFTNQAGQTITPYNAGQLPSGGGPGGQAGIPQGAMTASSMGARRLYGGYDPYAIPGYAPLYQLARGGLESQFGRARENVIGGSARGGAMGENLANLEMARAVETGSLPAQIATPLIQDIMGKAYGAAFGAPQTSLGGLSGAASSYANRYGTAMSGTMANQGMGMSSMSGLGSLAALGMSGGKGGKAAAPVEYAMGGGLFL